MRDIFSDDFDDKMLGNCDTGIKLGMELKRRRLERKVSVRDIADCTGRSCTRIYSIEKWKYETKRPWASSFLIYLLMLGYSLEDCFLVLSRFDMWPRSRGTAYYLARVLISYPQENWKNVLYKRENDVR